MFVGEDTEKKPERKKEHDLFQIAPSRLTSQRGRGERRVKHHLQASCARGDEFSHEAELTSSANQIFFFYFFLLTRMHKLF